MENKKVISLDEAFEQEFLDELVCNEFEGVLHEREYVDEIPMSDALDTFLREVCHESDEDMFSSGEQYERMNEIY